MPVALMSRCFGLGTKGGCSDCVVASGFVRGPRVGLWCGTHRNVGRGLWPDHDVLDFLEGR